MEQQQERLTKRTAARGKLGGVKGIEIRTRTRSSCMWQCRGRGREGDTQGDGMPRRKMILGGSALGRRGRGK